MMFLPVGDEACPADLADMVNDDARLEAMAQSATAIYQAKHTWTQRVKVLPGLMTPLIRSAGLGR